jgi:hypothetical protein
LTTQRINLGGASPDDFIKFAIEAIDYELLDKAAAPKNGKASTPTIWRAAAGTPFLNKR